MLKFIVFQCLIVKLCLLLLLPSLDIPCALMFRPTLAFVKQPSHLLPQECRTPLLVLVVYVKPFPLLTLPPEPMTSACTSGVLKAFPTPHSTTRTHDLSLSLFTWIQVYLFICNQMGFMMKAISPKIHLYQLDIILF